MVRVWHFVNKSARLWKISSQFSVVPGCDNTEIIFIHCFVLLTCIFYYLFPSGLNAMALHLMFGTSIRLSSFPVSVCQMRISPVPTVANSVFSCVGNTTSFTAWRWHVFNNSGCNWFKLSAMYILSFA